MQKFFEFFSSFLFHVPRWLIKRNEAKKNLAKINPADPRPNTPSRARNFGISAAYASYPFSRCSL